MLWERFLSWRSPNSSFLLLSLLSQELCLEGSCCGWGQRGFLLLMMFYSVTTSTEGTSETIILFYTAIIAIHNYSYPQLSHLVLGFRKHCPKVWQLGMLHIFCWKHLGGNGHSDLLLKMVMWEVPSLHLRESASSSQWPRDPEKDPARGPRTGARRTPTSSSHDCPLSLRPSVRHSGLFLWAISLQRPHSR